MFTCLLRSLLYKTAVAVLTLYLHLITRTSLLSTIQLSKMLTELPHTNHLPKSGKAVVPREPAVPNSKAIAQQLISKLDSVLASKDASGLRSIMHTDCW